MSKKKISAEKAAENKEQKNKVRFKYLPKEKKKKILQRVASVVLIVAVVALAGFYLYQWIADTYFKPNDVFYKDSYTVSDEKAFELKDVVVATAGDQKLTNGMLKMFYWKQATNFIANYGDYLGMIKLDPTQPLDKQMAIGGENFTWQHYFLEDAVAAWQRYMSLYQAGLKAETNLPKDLQEEFDGLYDKMTEEAKKNGYESVEMLIQDEIGAGVTYEDYQRYFEMYYLGLAYYDILRKDIVITDAEINAYYAEHADQVKSNYGIDKKSGLAGTVRHILIKPVDADKDGKYSKEEWDACLATAQKHLQAWKDANGNEESFGKLAEEVSEDPGSSVDGGLYKGIYKGYGFVESFENWTVDAARQPGDTDIIQSNHGYHIMYYVSGEEAWITCTRDMIRNEKLAELLNEAVKDYTVDMDYTKVAIDEMILATKKEEDKDE